MPVSRMTAAGLAQGMADLYAGVELQLLDAIVKHLRSNPDQVGWEERKLAELQLLRRRAEKILTAAQQAAEAEAAAMLETAYNRGQAAAQGDLSAAGVNAGSKLSHAERSVAALVAAQSETVQGLSLQVVRSVADAYRDAVVRGAAAVVTGADTRLGAAQKVLNDLATHGLTGFVDTAGRNWSLTSYVEMATRTTAAQAAVQGHLDRLQAEGFNLVVVSDSPRECPLCRPWEGKILSRGPVSALQENVLTGAMERVKVDGTVADATSAGLFHPNCTHNLSAYVHGATRAHDAGSDPSGYEWQQAQRAAERKVREWKRREAVALSPEARRLARSKVAQWQGQVREIVSAHDLPRKRNRESLTRAR